jgi:hypothetical protein
MDSINRVLNSKFFIPIFNIILFSLVWLNIFYIIKINDCNQSNLLLAQENSTIKQEINKIDNRETYQNSLSYQEKGIRERGYRLKDEEVVDLALTESLPENTTTDYLPNKKSLNENNISNWMAIFNGETFINQGRSFTCS